MSTAININTCFYNALTFLFLWTTTGIVLKTAMHYMILCECVHSYWWHYNREDGIHMESSVHHICFG